MAAPISEDLRVRIVALRERGLSYDDIAERLLVGRATVDRVLHIHRETGGVAPRQHGGGRSNSISDEELPRVRALVEAHQDETLEELAGWVRRELGIRLSPATMGRTMVRLRLHVEEEGADSQRAASPERPAEA